jgi:hypothetical protein
MGICKTELICAVRFVPLWTFILLIFLLKFIGSFFRSATMAGATKLSIRTLATVAAVGVGIGASRVNVKALLQNALTGPGSTSRIIAIVVVLANLKNFPLVWHVSTSTVSRYTFASWRIQGYFSLEPLLILFSSGSRS